MNNEHDLREGLDPLGPSAEDLDRFGGEFVRCPECHEEVYDQTAVCPSCGYALIERSSTPVWVAIVAAAVLLMILMYTLF